MRIHEVGQNNKTAWNAFVKQHYPPVGAFMQSWEWGEFQIVLGRKIGRYFMVGDAGEHLAAFTIVHHSLPFGLSYGYSPRGPVIADDLTRDKRYIEILKCIRQWAEQNLGHLVFLRLEPPLPPTAHDVKNAGFEIPAHYVQPRHNLFIPLDEPEDKIIAGLHPSTRSNLNRAARRGVTTKAVKKINTSDMEEFFSMTRDTIKRNSGKSAYPDRRYFESLIAAIPAAGIKPNPHGLELGVRYAYQNGDPAAAQFTLFFGDTATYLYGASYTDRLSSKATTYLHWIELQEAKRKGFRYYDLGGIDETLWPTLTNFKRQFRGKELSYIGNIDIPLQSKMYRIYGFFRTSMKLYKNRLVGRFIK